VGGNPLFLLSDIAFIFITFQYKKNIYILAKTKKRDEENFLAKS